MQPVSAAVSLCAKAMTLVPGAERTVVALGHRAPSCRPVASLCFHFVSALAEREPSQERVARVGTNASLVVTLSEHMFRNIYVFGTHEPETSTLLRKIVRPGQRWLDVGANIGLFTITLAELVGPTGTVIAYEPNPSNAAMVARSARLNNFDHVEVRQVAAGERQGASVLHVPIDANATPGGSGRASLIPAHSLGATKPISVQTVALDDDIPGDLRIDGVKLDVEGYERDVLMGMQRMLRQCPPRVVLFELLDTASALAKPSELLSTFEKNGYDCFNVTTRKRIDFQAPYAGGICDNVLAVRRDLVAEIAALWNA